MQHEAAVAQRVQSCLAERRQQVSGVGRMRIPQVRESSHSDDEQTPDGRVGGDLFARTRTTLGPEWNNINQHGTSVRGQTLTR